MKKWKRAKGKLLKHPNEGRAEYMVKLVNTIIARAHQIEVAKERQPIKKLLAYLYFVKGFIEGGLRFPEDGELRIAKSSLERPNAGRKKGNAIPTERQQVLKRFRKEHPTNRSFDFYEDWCNQQEPIIPEANRYSSPDSFRKALK